LAVLLIGLVVLNPWISSLLVFPQVSTVDSCYALFLNTLVYLGSLSLLTISTILELDGTPVKTSDLGLRILCLVGAVLVNAFLVEPLRVSLLFSVGSQALREFKNQQTLTRGWFANEEVFKLLVVEDLIQQSRAALERNKIVLHEADPSEVVFSLDPSGLEVASENVGEDEKNMTSRIGDSMAGGGALNAPANFI